LAEFFEVIRGQSINLEVSRLQEGDVIQGGPLDPLASFKFLGISIGTVIGAPEIAALRSAGFARFCPISTTASKSAGKTAVRTTRAGDKAVRTTRPDGSVIDISPKRVKEFVPNTHPKAPPGALNRVKFDNAIPGSKGFKRPPTQQELDILNKAK
jgi:hypothetical protein